jgi:HD-like signal output (HDOD) protein
MGIQVNYAPVVDVNNNPDNPVINDRSFGEDKYKVAKYGIAYMKGLQDEGVLACAKHFPGHGDVAVDSHFDLPVINKTMEQLDSLELYPFEELFEAGVGSVMIAHLYIPAIDTTANTATSLSRKNVTGLLRNKLNLTVKLLRYLQQHKRRSQTSEVVQIEQALLMLGVEAFYNKVPPDPLVQDALKGQTEALVHLLHVVHRSHRAAEYAFDWAVRLNDLHYEEVRIAALLHDLSEMLMWIFAPAEMLTIRRMQTQDKTLRSKAVQEQVLGFNLQALQKELVRAWELPQLLLMLMDDENANKTRVRNVVLAVNLARHSSNGWDDAALPDDYTALGELLRIPAMKRIRPSLRSASELRDKRKTSGANSTVMMR